MSVASSVISSLDFRSCCGKCLFSRKMLMFYNVGKLEFSEYESIFTFKVVNAQ